MNSSGNCQSEPVAPSSQGLAQGPRKAAGHSLTLSQSDRGKALAELTHTHTLWACSVCVCVCVARPRAECAPAAGSPVSILGPDLLFQALPSRLWGPPGATQQASKPRPFGSSQPALIPIVCDQRRLTEATQPETRLNLLTT